MSDAEALSAEHPKSKKSTEVRKGKRRG